MYSAEILAAVSAERDYAINSAWQEVTRISNTRPLDDNALFWAGLYAESLEAERVNS